MLQSLLGALWARSTATPRGGRRAQWASLAELARANDQSRCEFKTISSSERGQELEEPARNELAVSQRQRPEEAAGQIGLRFCADYAFRLIETERTPRRRAREQAPDALFAPAVQPGRQMIKREEAFSAARLIAPLAGPDAAEMCRPATCSCGSRRTTAINLACPSCRCPLAGLRVSNRFRFRV